jgi:hypothetical protein
MKTNQRLIIKVIVAAFIIGASLWAYNWHYRRYTWPAEIQSGLLGHVVASADELVRQEGNSAYGEGMFRWEYKMRNGSQHLQRLCAGKPLSTCEFTRSRQLEEGVSQAVRYYRGLLTVEEVWS